jgi:hypothetical protein
MARSAALKLVNPAEADKQPSRFLSDLVRRASVVAPHDGRTD